MGATVLVALNFKGGVGKTTLTAHLGRALCSSYNRKVLLVDLDPQMNLTQLFFRDDQYEELLKKGKRADRLFIYKAGDIPAFPGSRYDAPRSSDVAERLLTRTNSTVEIVPGAFDTVWLAINPDVRDINDCQDMFREFVNRSASNFDYIIIDVNPGASVLTLSALESADFILCPINNDAYSYKGALTLHRFIGDRLPHKLRYNSKLFLLIFNAMASPDKDTVSRTEAAVKKNSTLFPFLLRTKIPESRLLASDFTVKGLFYDRVSEANKTESTELERLFNGLAKEVIERTDKANSVRGA